MDSVTLPEKAVSSFETSDIDSPATRLINLEDQNLQLYITETSNHARLYKYPTGSSNGRFSRGTNLTYVVLPATYSVSTNCTFSINNYPYHHYRHWLSIQGHLHLCQTNYDVTSQFSSPHCELHSFLCLLFHTM